MRTFFHNQLLIFSQRPDATLVAGYRRWQVLGRFVRKGEKGIQIFAPVSGKCRSCDGAGGITETGAFLTCSRCMGSGKYSGFKLVYVFDVSQTKGEEIPDLDAVRPTLLSGDAPEGIWDALVAQAKEAGFEVVREQRGRENGYCDFGKEQIAVRPDVAPAQAVKTLVHELAHALLHGDELARSRKLQEVEVESVAFIVLDALGLASDEYSFPYVARWSDGELDILKESAERMISCARQVLKGLELETEPENA